MKLFFTPLLLLMLGGSVQAQSAIAKIKYEQAEEAFVANDYRTTLTRLDEAQKLLGSSNPKILYLRLMAAKGIIAGGKYNYDFLSAARSDAEYYLKKYSEVEGIEGKFREIYEFSEALEKLPAAKDVFEQKEAEAAQRRAVWIKSRSIQVSDSLISVYRVKKVATVQEFMAYNPSAFAGLQKQKDVPKGFIMYMNTSMSTGPSSLVFNANGLQAYTYVVQGLSVPDMAKKVYQSLLDLYPVDLENEWVERKEISEIQKGLEMGFLHLKPPATANLGAITISYAKFPGGGAKVDITFSPQ